MAERLKNLDRFQKVILIILAVLTVAYAVAYTVAANRTGLVYRDEILRPLSDGSGWAGTVDYAEITISFADGGMYYTVDGQTTGPYSIRRDETALPKDNVMGNMEGIELLCGDRVLFRGGAVDLSGTIWMESSNGKTSIGGISAINTPSGNQKPTNEELYQLLTDPLIGRKGNWTGFMLGLFISAVFAVSILFADELFRWHLSFSIRNADYAEPSEWEIASRYISWVIAPILAFALYTMGLGEIVI